MVDSCGVPFTLVDIFSSELRQICLVTCAKGFKLVNSHICIRTVFRSRPTPPINLGILSSWTIARLRFQRIPQRWTLGRSGGRSGAGAAASPRRQQVESSSILYAIVGCCSSGADVEGQVDVDKAAVT